MELLRVAEHTVSFCFVVFLYVAMRFSLFGNNFVYFKLLTATLELDQNTRSVQKVSDFFV